MITIPNEGIPHSPERPEFRKLYEEYLPYEIDTPDVELLEAHGFKMYTWHKPEAYIMGFRIDAMDVPSITVFQVT